MAATPASVRACSLTGEFNALLDGQIQGFVEEAALHYGDLPRRVKKPGIVDKIVSLHAAHLLHQAIKLEAGEDGEGGVPGDVKSASLDRIGSWTFGNTSDVKQQDDKVPLEDWAQSSYGRRWRTLWGGVPTGTMNTGA